MIDSKAMKDLFNPYEVDFMDINDLLDVTGLSFKKLLKIHVEDECSKSIDESCMNLSCGYNLIEMHNDETYVDVFKEVEQERMRVQEQVERDKKRFYGL